MDKPLLRKQYEVTTFCSQLGKSWVELGNGWERYDNQRTKRKRTKTEVERTFKKAGEEEC